MEAWSSARLGPAMTDAPQYSKAELLRLRPASCAEQSSVNGIQLEDVPEDEAGANVDKQSRNARSKRGPIGPVTECIPVDSVVLQGKQSELRRIETATGVRIREKAGLRNYTVMITGTSAMVEKALPMVEQALSGEEEAEPVSTSSAALPAPSNPEPAPGPAARPALPEPPSEPPPPSPAMALFGQDFEVVRNTSDEPLPWEGEDAAPVADVCEEPAWGSHTAPDKPVPPPNLGQAADDGQVDEEWEIPQHWAVSGPGGAAVAEGLQLPLGSDGFWDDAGDQADAPATVLPGRGRWKSRAAALEPPPAGVEPPPADPPALEFQSPQSQPPEDLEDVPCAAALLPPPVSHDSLGQANEQHDRADSGQVDNQPDGGDEEEEEQEEEANQKTKKKRPKKKKKKAEEVPKAEATPAKAVPAALPTTQEKVAPPKAVSATNGTSHARTQDRHTPPQQPPQPAPTTPTARVRTGPPNTPAPAPPPLPGPAREAAAEAKAPPRPAVDVPPASLKGDAWQVAAKANPWQSPQPSRGETLQVAQPTKEPTKAEIWQIASGRQPPPPPPPSQKQAPPPPQSAPSGKARQPPKAKAMDPLPQRTNGATRAARPAMLSGGMVLGDSANGAQKWMERPVEKLSLTAAHYEEEEDPELACYLWDRKSQRPKNDHMRAAPKQPPAPPAQQPGGPHRAPPPPPPQRQRVLLDRVMEMGFPEHAAKRALTATGWAGVEEAMAALLGS